MLELGDKFDESFDNRLRQKYLKHLHQYSNSQLSKPNWDVRWLQRRMLVKHFDSVSVLCLATCFNVFIKNRTNHAKRH